MVVYDLPKVETRVRFPSLAPAKKKGMALRYSFFLLFGLDERESDRKRVGKTFVFP